MNVRRRQKPKSRGRERAEATPLDGSTLGCLAREDRAGLQFLGGERCTTKASGTTMAVQEDETRSHLGEAEPSTTKDSRCDHAGHVRWSPSATGSDHSLNALDPSLDPIALGLPKRPPPPIDLNDMPPGIGEQEQTAERPRRAGLPLWVTHADRQLRREVLCAPCRQDDDASRGPPLRPPAPRWWGQRRRQHKAIIGGCPASSGRSQSPCRLEQRHLVENPGGTVPRDRRGAALCSLAGPSSPKIVDSSPEASRACRRPQGRVQSPLQLSDQPLLQSGDRVAPLPVDPSREPEPQVSGLSSAEVLVSPVAGAKGRGVDLQTPGDCDPVVEGRMEEPAQQAPRGRVRILVSSSRLREAPPKGERAVRIGIEPAPSPHGIVPDRRRHLGKPEPRKEVADALRPETGTAEDPCGEVPRHTTGAESQSAPGRPGRIGTECR